MSICAMLLRAETSRMPSSVAELHARIEHPVHAEPDAVFLARRLDVYVARTVQQCVVEDVFRILNTGSLRPWLDRDEVVVLVEKLELRRLLGP